MLRHSSLFLFLVLIVTSCEQVSSELQPESHPWQVLNPAALDSILQDHIDSGNFAMTYARVESAAGELLYEGASHNEQLMGDRRLAADNPVRIWSMSKAVTAVLTMDLIEDGMLALDDDVLKFIPEFDRLQVAVFPDATDSTQGTCPFELEAVTETMTIRQLLNHQAGFYYGETGYDCIDKPFKGIGMSTPQSTDTILAKLSRIPLMFQPGTDEQYGFNTSVLGFVLERASGRSLDQLVQERLREPLGLDQFGYNIPAGATQYPFFVWEDSALKRGGAEDANLMGQVPGYDTANCVHLGGEGMMADALSYARFLRMLVNGGEGVLEPSSIDTLVAPQTQLDNPWGHMGFTIWVSGDSMRQMKEGDAGLWIGGGYEYTQYWMDPKRDIVGVLMTQMRNSPSGHTLVTDLRGAIYEPWLAEDR